MATENTGVIRESELIQLDGTTDKLIQKLETLNSVLNEVAGTIKQHAGAMANSLQRVNVVAESGKKAVDTAEIATERLERAYRELEIAMSETGRQIVEVKTLTSQANKESKVHYAAINAMSGSYDALKIALKQAQEDFKRMSEEERENDQIGGVVIERIRQLSARIKELDAQLKPHVSAIRESAEASRDASIADSQEARAVEEVSRQTARDAAEHRRSAQATREAAQATEDLNREYTVTIQDIGSVALSLRDYNRYQKLIAKANASAEGSSTRLQAMWKAYNILIDNAANANGKLSDTTVRLTEKGREYYNQLVKIQEATGRYTLNVGNYRSAWDGLGMSVNQLVRELPSAAISLNTFFVAISNNIPILIDEINKLRRTNKLLAKEGKATIPIGKSIVKALFSWQSLIVLAITVLSMFGEEIFQAIGKLFKFKDAVLTTSEAIKNINKELESTNGDYGDKVVLFKKLKEQFKELRTEAEKQKFLEQYRSKLEEVGIQVNEVNELEHHFSTEGTKEAIEAFKQRAKALAGFKLAAEEYEKSMVLKEQSKEVSVQDMNLFDFIKAGIGKGDIEGVFEKMGEEAQKRKQDLLEEAQAAEEAGNKYFDLAWEMDKALDPDKTNSTNVHVDNLRDLTDRINRMRLSTEEKYQKSMLAIQDDGYAKERSALIIANKKKNDELKYNQEKIQEWLQGEGTKYEEFTDEQRQKLDESLKNISQTMLNNDKELYESLLKLDAQYSVKRLGVLQDLIQDRLTMTQKGGEQEYQLQLSLLETQKKIALQEDALREKDDQKGAKAITDYYDQQIAYFKGTWSLELLEAQQTLEEERFNIVQRSTYATKRFEIEQERAFIQKKLELAEKGQLSLSDIEKDTLRATLAALDQEMKDLNRDITPQGLLSRIGLTDENIGALEQATNYVVEQLHKIFDAEEELRKQQVDIAKEKTDLAQQAFEAEVEARRQGYANNVASARKDLLLAKKQQADKEKLLKEAQARAAKLDSITQASSLLTASAEIWKSLSGIPYVGPALAIAMIGTMWTSFATAKAKSKQLAVQEYGEGGYEVLEGGSHSSGNDIDLGVNNRKGKRMKAEGGEALAIINKRQTRRYRKVLPSIVESINKGVFEQKFSQSLPNIQPNVIVNQSTDLSQIERDIQAIKEQNDTKIITLSDGTIIKQVGNVTTKIHR